ncbi:DUF2851 family protein [candidate division KSB1 bacterium]|nr:DUF2851 family protein [candidate division KSB1 bacterium]
MDQPFDNLSENFLYHIWDGLHLRLKELMTMDGRRIEIIHRGKWNMDSGPDFLGAILKFNESLIKGDVEIHIRVSDWFNHNHQNDAAYNNVILHAVLQKPAKPTPAVTESGRIPQTLILGDFLDESLSRLRARVDKIQAEPPKSWPDICLLSGKENPKILQRLEFWGLERLNQKKQRFLEERSYFQFNDLFYQGLCEALGYSKNQNPFLKLALLLSLDKIWTLLSHNDHESMLEKLQGVLFGAAGFLEQTNEKKESYPESTRKFVNGLCSHWVEFKKQYSMTNLDKSEWRFLRLRPSNFPTVRLAGLCRLLLLKRSTGFMEPVLSIFRDLKNKPQKIFNQLQRQFIVPGYGFWQDHVRFEEAEFSSKKPLTLIGTSKAREIVINVVLPVVSGYAEETEDYELLSLVKQTYLIAPKNQSNELTRKMDKQVFKNKSKEITPALSACHQQGFIYLAKLMCPNWHCYECIHPKHEIDSPPSHNE